MAMPQSFSFPSFPSAFSYIQYFLIFKTEENYHYLQSHRVFLCSVTRWILSKQRKRTRYTCYFRNGQSSTGRLCAYRSGL